MFQVQTPTQADRRYARRDAADNRREELRVEREARNAAALEAAKRAGLPELSGSDKQVAWAASIRAGILERAGADLSAAIAAEDPDAPLMLDALDALSAQDDAAWWIDHRAIRVPFAPADGPAYLETVDLFAVVVDAYRRASYASVREEAAA